MNFCFSFSKGLGYADVENRVPCKPETVMRIASISKSLTMVALAKLWEAGKLDLDMPVQHYVPEFPEKEYEGEKVMKLTVHFTNHMLNCLKGFIRFFGLFLTIVNGLKGFLNSSDNLLGIFLKLKAEDVHMTCFSVTV